MGKNWCFTTSCLLKLYFAFCLIFYNINFQLLPRIVNFIFHGIFIMGIQGSGYLTHGKKVPQETSGFCLKHLKMTPPEELEVASALTLKSISSFAFTKMPFDSQNCPSIFQNYPFIFQKCPFVSQNCPFVFQKCPFIFQKYYFIFQRCPFISWNCPFIFQNCLFICQKWPIVFQNRPLVFQKCLIFIYYVVFEITAGKCCPDKLSRYFSLDFGEKVNTKLCCYLN